MVVSALFVYIFYGFIIFFILYLIVLVLELGSGNRLASNFRLYLDEQILAIFKMISAHLEKAECVAMDSLGIVQEEIFSPVTDPVQRQYGKIKIMKSGRIELKQKPRTKVSLHLRKLKSMREGEK